MKLVIIEGIGKKDTIKKYLGSGYQVMATGGHFRDLKKRDLSVDVENGYKPQYVISSDKKDVVKALKEAAAKAESVLIATDPDRAVVPFLLRSPVSSLTDLTMMFLLELSNTINGFLAL